LSHHCSFSTGASAAVSGAAVSGEPWLGFVRGLGVVVFLLPLGFLAPSGQGLGNA
jgi:hypothetical protein